MRTFPLLAFVLVLACDPVVNDDSDTGGGGEADTDTDSETDTDTDTDSDTDTDTGTDTDTSDTDTSDTDPPTDVDQDGFDSPLDCDDSDPAVFPGAPDSRGNGVDENCDGVDGNLGHVLTLPEQGTGYPTVAAGIGELAYVAGYYQNADFTLTTTSFEAAPGAGREAFLFRLDEDGGPLAKSRFTGPGFTAIGYLDAHPDSGLLVSGIFDDTVTINFEGTGETTLSEPNPTSRPDNYFVAAMDQDLVPQWAISTSQTVNGSATPGVGLRTDGSGCLAGAYNGVLTLNHPGGALVMPGVSREHGYVAGFDSSGVITWTRVLQHSQDTSFFHNVRALDDGRCMALGYTTASGLQLEPTDSTTVLQGTASGNHGILLALDAVGDIGWWREVDHAGSDYAWSLADTQDGIVVAGSLSAEATFDPGMPTEQTASPLAGQNLYVARYALDGDLEWVRVFTGADIAPKNISGLDGDAVLITGWGVGDMSFPTPAGTASWSSPSQGWVGWAAKLDSAGDVSWVHALEGTTSSSDVGMYGGAQLSDGRVFLTGYVDGDGFVDPGTADELPVVPFPTGGFETVLMFVDE